MKKALIVAALLLATVAGCKQTPKDAPKAALVAANLPLTGPFSVYGQAIKEGAELAAARPDVASVGLLFDWQDNSGDGAKAAAIAKLQLVRQPFVGILGIKPQYMAAVDQWHKAALPLFAWVFDADIRKTGGEMAYRTWVNYRHEPELFFSFVDKLKAKKVAIIYVQLPHTDEEFNNIVIPGLQQRGIDAAVHRYQYGTDNFRVLAAKIAASKPDAIILNGFQNELASQIKALRENGIDGKSGRIMATYDMMDAAKILTPEEIEGVRFSAPRFVTRATEPQVVEFKKAFYSKYGREPLYTSAYAYDMLRAIALAAGGTPMADVSFAGVTGPVSFDAKGDLPPAIDIAVYRGGQIFTDN